MENLRRQGRLSLSSVVLVLGLLTVSLLAAGQARAATPAPSSASPQVVPTVLSGYKEVGPLSSSAVVDVSVGIPLENVQSLQYLEQEISMPGSPMFEHFLTPTQVQRYLPTAEFNAALAYLQQGGFRVVTTGLDSIIVAQGTEAQASRYLGLQYYTYSNGQESYYTASGTSPIPGAYLYSTNFTAALLAHPTTLATNSSSSPTPSATPSQTNQSAVSGAYSIPDLQTVYNATGLYAKGDTGSGFTVGILDFEGDPYIAGQLQTFDRTFGLPSSPFKVVPIGPYNPSLGMYTGWDIEISLDVESVHSMAPGAAIDLYIANSALPLSADIAAIVQQGAVNDLSQSFTLGPESIISALGASGLEMNVLLPDEYYMLGSAEGMSFLSSTGDVGGSGYSGGPEGTPGYPSTSPYVTAVGGTTTYLAFQGSSVSSFYQTAWSNYGFVPNGINYGGGTGGVSILEPKPWYQSSLSSPSGFASGRLVPDLSLNANGVPGVTIVLPGNLTTVEGGTSEASPLLAGLLALIMGSTGAGLGLINPTLYNLAESSSTYAKAYYPVTFGYTIPWVSAAGFNMATGWGAPNIGEMAGLFGRTTSASLGVNVSATVGGSTEENVLPGQTLSISATVTGSHAVTTGSFTASLETLAGTVATVPLTYNASTGRWVGQLTVPATGSGLSYLTVSGNSGGVSGTGFAEFFLGYVATFILPTADSPYSSHFGIVADVNVTTLSGARAPGPFNISALSYSIKSNTYQQVAAYSLKQGSGSLWTGNLTGDWPLGPAIIAMQGDAYGYLPFTNGVSMQSSFIETSVLGEPGVVAPGQTIFVLASLSAPVNTPPVLSAEDGLSVSFNVGVGSNVTAYLVSQAGKVVAESPLYLNTYLTSIDAIQGTIDVPTGIAPGLYDVILNSTFNSYDLNVTIDGSFFGQVYVAPALTPFTVSLSTTTPYEGQTVTVTAKIDYPNGTSVKYGVYSGGLYPKALQNSYNTLSFEYPFSLTYDSSSGYWTANVTLPSAYNAGGSLQLDQGALYLSGPYEVFVTGFSADGLPTDTGISTQTQMQVQPYYYLSGVSVTSLPQSSQVAFSGDTVVGPPASAGHGVPQLLSGDVFIGSNTFQGGVYTISQSQVQGTLNLNDANVTLVGVSGGSIAATNSVVSVRDSSLQSIKLTNSVVSANASTLGAITPPLPAVSVQQPASGAVYTGSSGSATVSGQGVSSVSVYLDGTLLQKTSASSTVTFPLPSGSLSVGVHQLTVVAAQDDGLSSSTTVYFSTDAALVAANDSISSVSTSLGAVSSSLGSVNSSVGALSSQVSSEKNTIDSLTSQLNSANYGVYALGAVAVLALILAMVAMVRKPGHASSENQPPSPPPPPQDAGTSTPPSGPSGVPPASS